ncbi:MAG TPA: hypothetical protein VIE40_08020 [Dehalococcoidia bacterium]|jgi:hypothetical protein
MQFFIALAVLTTASAAYLIHQFWRRGLAETAAGGTDEDSGEELRAA